MNWNMWTVEVLCEQSQLYEDIIYILKFAIGCIYIYKMMLNYDNEIRGSFGRS